MYVIKFYDIIFKEMKMNIYKLKGHLFFSFFVLVSLINTVQAETWVMFCAQPYDTSLPISDRGVVTRYRLGQVWARINFGILGGYNIETSFGKADDDASLGGEGAKKMPIFIQHKVNGEAISDKDFTDMIRWAGRWQMQNIGINKWRIKGRLMNAASNNVRYTIDSDLICSDWIKE